MSDAATKFIELLRASLAEGTFVRLTLSAPTVPGPERVAGRRVDLRAGPRLQMTLREGRRETMENVPLEAAPGWVAARLGVVFRSAFLGTTRRDWQLSSSKSGEFRLVGHKPAETTVPDAAHDDASHRLLDPVHAPWLRALGVTDERDRVRERMGDKFRQIARYIEILDALVDDLGWTRGRRVRILDAGSGKGYLTFAVWHLMRVIRGIEAEVVGIEERADLVEKTSRAAENCPGLSFRRGRISDGPPGPWDSVIALHACNTATDDAIRLGIASGSELILAAPCCHKELRPQIDSARGAGVLAPILRHGILRERFSEWLTDGLRALHLELSGYDTQVMEFVPGEHTPKNLLIAAVLRQRPVPPDLRDRIAAIRAQFGVLTQALDAQPKPVSG
jgi:SAM-dependent methyltransferase